MYENGEGVVQDLDQALYWYRKAAEAGYTEAQHKCKLYDTHHNNKETQTTREELENLTLSIG
jgi:TPR repeat protein